ncbi:MAG: mycothiol system anti-sigma-R factor [Actinobacteria bacterium]|nr:mycothiol system anti-sigma-R factor [Actinomycetota bacterium]
MSCGGIHETPCSEVLSEVALLIDGEINEPGKIHAIEHHFEECGACCEEMEHERRMHDLLHDVLTRSCMDTQESISSPNFAGQKFQFR